MLVTKKQEQNSYYCYLRNEIIELRNFPFMVDHFRSWPQTSEILEDTILRYPTNLPEYTAVSIPPGSLRCGGPLLPSHCVQPSVQANSTPLLQKASPATQVPDVPTISTPELLIFHTTWSANGTLCF